jgi:hypothetical protein
MGLESRQVRRVPSNLDGRDEGSQARLVLSGIVGERGAMDWSTASSLDV